LNHGGHGDHGEREEGNGLKEENLGFSEGGTVPSMVNPFILRVLREISVVNKKEGF